MGYQLATDSDKSDDEITQAKSNVHEEKVRIESDRKQKGSESLFSIGKDVSGLSEKGNIDLNRRKVVRNPDKSYMTEKSITIEVDGKQVLIPTIVEGKAVSNKEAVEHFKETGEHLGKFENEKDAEDYAQALHLRQEKYYK